MGILKVRQGEVYTDDYPLMFTVTESDGTTPVVLDETWVGVYLRDTLGTVQSLVGTTSGNSWDSSTNGKFHATMAAAQSGAMQPGSGDYYVQITFGDGAVKKTDTARMLVLKDWD